MPVARLDGLLSESAERFADRIAVEEAGNGRLTYRELHEAAVQLRNQLVAAGVGPGDRVGLYLEKSLASVAAIFGILNAGAAYVPVDPHAPPERNRYIFTNCPVRAIVTDSLRAEALGAVDGGQAFEIGRASGRERGCQYESISGVPGALIKKSQDRTAMLT